MKYMLLIYANTSEAPEITPEERQAAIQAFFAYKNSNENRKAAFKAEMEIPCLMMTKL